MMMLRPAKLSFVTGADEKRTGSVAAVRPDGQVVALQPMVLWGLEVLRWIAAEVGLEELECTSGPDGSHSWTSLHYAGCAPDLRTRTMTKEQKARFLERGREELGHDFDLVDEGSHIHMEWQPKGPGRDVRPRRTAEWFPKQEQTA